MAFYRGASKAANGHQEADEEFSEGPRSFVSDGRYRNKQRILLVASRGITARHRHLLEDVRKLLPHHKKDGKFDAKHKLNALNEICDVKSCNGCVYLEARKRADLYMWIARTPHGPSVKFHVSNIHTMDELKLTGNCMLGSRPLLSFDSAFDEAPHFRVMKAILSETFGTPRGHPKSKPFVDRVMSFFAADGKIWVRNYQIVDESDEGKLDARAARRDQELTTLVEIGPRFVLTPIRIFQAAFGGATLYANDAFVSPNARRAELRRKDGEKYVARTTAKRDMQERREANVLPKDELSSVFE